MGIVPSLRSVLSIPPLTPEPRIPGHTGKGETVASNTGAPMLRPGTQAEPEPGSAATEDTSSWLVDPETLLLVEDDPGDALLVEELIADSGVTASLTWVRSLAEARGRLRAGPVPGCVLLDLNLPDALGMEAVRQVIAAAPAAPVVVLTGLAEEGSGLAAV